MGNYFYDMLPPEELGQVEYIPTIPQFLDWLSDKWADRPALSDTVLTYTYAQMCSRIARRRSFLLGLGLSNGDKVAIWERSSIDAIEMFLAVSSAGMVSIMLPTQLPAQAVAACCTRFGVSLLVSRAEFLSQTEGMPCRVVGSDSIAENEAASADVCKDDPAAIFFTGGTTGAPKGAILPHRALMRGAFNGIFAPGSQLYEGQSYICLLPLSHVFGLIRGSLSVFYQGALWYPAEDMKSTIGKIPVIRPTTLVLVPGLCEILLGLVKMYGPQFLGGRLNMIIAGAANVPPRLMSEFDRFGIKLLAGYGMTEGANLTAGNADVATRPTSVGKIYPGQETKVVDGELWFRGDNVFLGYYGDPEKTAGALTEDGWLRTGDLVEFDADGFMYIVGRIKNLIILSNGENVSPESIEEPFYRSDLVRDCLVRQQDDAITIEILPNMPAFEGQEWDDIVKTLEALVDRINSELPSTHRITRVSVRKEDFKRTGSLKVSRNQ